MPSQLSPEEITEAAARLKALGGQVLSPLDHRFLVPELLGYLSHDALHRYSLAVMRAYVDTLREHGEMSEEIARTVMAAYTPEKVPCAEADRVEDEITRHDVRAKVRVAQAAIPEPMRGWAYLAPTSYDLIDTAKAAALRDAAMEVILPDAIRFERALIKRARDAEEDGPLVMMGRTHKQHAAPTTFGHVVGEWLGGFHPPTMDFYSSTGYLRGKFSGFVGTRAAQQLLFDTSPRLIARGVMQRMHLDEDPLTGQVVHQAYYSPYFFNLIGMAGGVAKFAEDIRNYSQTEVGEMVEGRASKAVGSSTGAHKANPINAENVGGHWRELVGSIIPVLEDTVTDFQRDLRNSANTRYYIAAIPAMTTYTIRRATQLAEKFSIRRSRIERNIDLTNGQVIAEPLQLQLQLWSARQGRFLDAHEHVKGLSEKALETGRPLQDVTREDAEIAAMLKELTPAVAETIMDPQKYIGTAHQDAQRFFGEIEADLKRLEEAIATHNKNIVYV